MSKRSANSGLRNSSATRSGLSIFSFVDGAVPASKRKRTITSCALCRKKKVRCDKSRPVCGYCKRTGLMLKCEYPEPSWEDSKGTFVSDYQKAAAVPLAHINIEPVRRKNSIIAVVSAPIGNPSSQVTASEMERKNSSGLQTTFQVLPKPLPNDTSFPNPPNATFNQSSFNGYAQMNTHASSGMVHPDMAPSSQIQCEGRHFRPVDYSRRLQDHRHKSSQNLSPSRLDSNARGFIVPSNFSNGTCEGSKPLPTVTTVDQGITSSRRTSTTSVFPSRETSATSQDESLEKSDLERTSEPIRSDGDDLDPNSKPKESLTFYNYTEPVVMRGGRLLAPGPLALVSILKKDPFLLVLLYKIRTDRLIEYSARKAGEAQQNANDISDVPKTNQTRSNKNINQPSNSTSPGTKSSNTINGLDKSMDNTAKATDLLQQIVFVSDKAGGKEEEFQKRLIENEQIEDINQADIVEKTAVFNDISPGGMAVSASAAAATTNESSPENTNHVPNQLASDRRQQQHQNQHTKDIFPDASLRVCASSDEYMRACILYVYSILPSRKVIWTLFDRFFNSSLVGAMPFSLQRQLNIKLEGIIGPKSFEDNGKVGLKLDKRFDFSYVAQLLYIMRISYLSVFKTEENTEEEKFILAHPIGIEFVNAAQMCLNQFKVLRRGAVPIILSFLFMKSYLKYAPEDGDSSDGCDSQVFLGIAIQMMNSIGLNRDLSHVKQFASNVAFVNLTRLLWHEIVTMDLSQAMSFGSGTLINPRYSDTKLPELYNIFEGDSGRQFGDFDFESYSAIIHNYETGDKLNRASRDILDLVLRIDEKVKISELTPKLDKLESTLAEVGCGSLKDILDMDISKNEGVIKKHNKFTKYLELKSSLFVIYYHLYANDPLHQDFTYKKLISSALEIVPMALLLGSANNGKVNLFEKLFGPGSQLVIIPSLISNVHKFNQIFVSLCCRCLDITFNYYPEPQSKRAKLIKKIFDISIYYFRMCYDAFKNLSSTYFQAWRAVKGISYIYQMITNKNGNIWNREVAVLQKGLQGEFNYHQHMPKKNDLEMKTDEELEDLVALLYNKKDFADIVNRLRPFYPNSDRLVIDDIFNGATTFHGFKLTEFANIVSLIFELNDFKETTSIKSLNADPASTLKKRATNKKSKTPATVSMQTGNKSIDLMLNTIHAHSHSKSSMRSYQDFQVKQEPMESPESPFGRRSNSGSSGKQDYETLNSSVFLDPEIDRLWISSILGQNGLAATPGHSDSMTDDLGYAPQMIDGQYDNFSGFFPNGHMAIQTPKQHLLLQLPRQQGANQYQPQVQGQGQFHDLYNEDSINLEVSAGDGNPVVMNQRNNQQKQQPLFSVNLSFPRPTQSHINGNDNLQRFSRGLTTTEAQNLMTGGNKNDATVPHIRSNAQIFNNNGGNKQNIGPAGQFNNASNQASSLRDLELDLGGAFDEELNTVMNGGFDFNSLVNDLSTFGTFGL